MIKTRILDLPDQSSTHSHPEHQLIVGLQGCADFEVMGQGGAVNRLHACLVPGHERHAFSGRGSNHMLILDLAMEPGGPGGLGEDTLDRLFDKPRFVQLDHGLQGLLDFAAHELGASPVGSPITWHLGGILLHALHDRMFSTPLPMRPVASLDLSRIDRFVQAHLDEPISVADMAAQVCISPSHFHTLFKQVAGQSPHQYVLDARLRQAIGLLRQSLMSVAEIADRCGFSSQSALAHAIRKQTGQTPRKLRLEANC
ncbi:MAG TPA: AraC family transcriptional regulator [Pseudomonas xinjiangensis]|uniref:AraC family transcriptional regulator n=2 Tax=root TaxID=1 RepID=A0A7V1BQ69_9GAMM|nr:AraC family transcriptional regulator [Halopseudomonas xinjiangensis]HEC49359.1 AraC family transcriptional regulator [Halopseudomonas xinjiangensis]